MSEKDMYIAKRIKEKDASNEALWKLVFFGKVILLLRLPKYRYGNNPRAKNKVVTSKTSTF